MKNGAHDFLQKPIQMARLEQSILRAQEVVGMRRELTHLRSAQRRTGSDFVTGSSAKMQSLFSQARRASQASVSVLITGETGTGKEILAHFIHASGPRAEKPFIAVNCAAIQSTMLESELFGYEAGISPTLHRAPSMRFALTTDRAISANCATPSNAPCCFVMTR